MAETRVSEDVIEFLARRVTSHIRELEGALNRVVAYATLTRKPVDLDFTREVLADVLRANDRKITIDEIQRRVAEHFRIKAAEIGRSYGRDIVGRYVWSAAVAGHCNKK